MNQNERLRRPLGEQTGTDIQRPQQLPEGGVVFSQDPEAERAPRDEIAENMSKYFASDQFREKNPTTQQIYAYDLGHFHGNIEGVTRLEDITNEHIDKYVEACKGQYKLSDATVQRRLAPIRGFFRWAASVGIPIGVDSYTYASETKQSHHLSYLTPEKERRLIERTSGVPRDTAIIIFGVRTGEPISEILALNKEDVVETSGGSLAVKFKKGSRVVEFDEEDSKIVRSYVGSIDDDTSYLFPPKINRQKRMTRQGVWLKLKKYGQEMQIPDINSRTLRNTYIIRALQRNDKDQLRSLGLSPDYIHHLETLYKKMSAPDN